MANTPEQLEALKVAREAFPEGSTLYTILRSISRSGATCKVSVMVLRHCAPTFPHHAVGVTLGLRRGTWEGHDVLELPNFYSPDDIAGHLSRAVYGDPTAIKGRAI
jgi:hypothetical protein